MIAEQVGLGCCLAGAVEHGGQRGALSPPDSGDVGSIGDLSLRCSVIRD